MAYQSLYRKYRPQNFADVMGQGAVTRTLQNALASGRIAHGYLFTGTRGTAKTTVARLLAKSLNCLSQTHPVTEPCNICEACIGITNGSAMDVIEMDAASHRGVADVEEVRRSVGFGPMQFRYKVFIIDEAHQLSSDAKDAFLKTLEEPPPNVVFILATTEPQAIPITIRSRCQQFDFKRGSLADIATRLRYVLEHEGVGYTTEAINLIARGAEGSWRDSLSLLEQVLAFAPEQITAAAVDTVLGTLDSEMLAHVTAAIAGRDAPTAFTLAGAMLDAGKEARTLLRTLAGHFRDLLLVSVGGPVVSAELTPEEVVKLQSEAKLFTPPQMLRAIDILNEAQGETRWNNQHRLLVEMAFLKLMTIGDPAAAGNFVIAPIVFAAEGIQPKIDGTVIVPPKVRATTALVQTVAPISPLVAPPTTATEKAVQNSETVDETLPSAYFAPDSDDDDDSEMENEASDRIDVDEESEEAGADSVDPPTAPIEDLEPETGENPPSLFDLAENSPAQPKARVSVPTTVPVAAVPLTTLPAAPIITPDVAHIPAPAPVVPTVVPPLLEVEEEPLTLENVQDIWHRFQEELSQRSKTVAVNMAGVQPVAVNGHVVTLMFLHRQNFEMMETKREKQEFVRKLIARCLGRESVGIRLTLDASAVPAPKRVVDSANKGRHDRLALLDTIEPSEPVAGTPKVAQSAPRPAVSSPARSVAATVVASGSSEGNDPSGALDDPLVQETLSIFGGEIVHEES